MAISPAQQVSWYQNVSILDFLGGSGDNWSCKTCKAPVESSGALDIDVKLSICYW